MKPRILKAQIIEDEYMLRLKNALADKDPSQANEIIQNIREHIEEAVNESSENEITPALMANILERIGSPEAYINEYSIPHSENKNNNTVQNDISTEDTITSAGFINKIWIACLINVIGLYIPIIELYFCNIIYLVFLIVIFGSYSPIKNTKKNNIFVLSVIAIAMLFVLCIANVLEINAPGFALIAFPVSIIASILLLVIDWKVLGEVSSVLKYLKHYEAAEFVNSSRVIYVICYIVFDCLVMFVGTIIGLSHKWSNAEIHSFQLITPLYMLPFSWLVGWLFMLRPISKAKEVINK